MACGLAGRLSGERWDGRARRRRRRHRRRAPGLVGARRAAVTRSARRRRRRESSTTSPATPPPRAHGRSSASRSSRGSSVTRRSSSASLRSSRAGGRGASRADSARPIRRDGRARRAHLPPAGRACDRRSGPGSACLRSRYPTLAPSRKPMRASFSRTSCWTTSDGSYSIRAPLRIARTRKSISSPDRPWLAGAEAEPLVEGARLARRRCDGGRS